MTTQKNVRGQGLHYVSGWTWGAQSFLQRNKARSQPSTPRADVSGGDAEAETVKTTQEPVNLTLADTDFSQEPSGSQRLPELGSVLRLARCLQLEAWCTLIWGQDGRYAKQGWLVMLARKLQPVSIHVTSSGLPGKHFLTVTSRGKCL